MSQRIGIPYAYGFLDDENRFFVSCPRCGQRCYGPITGIENDEDEISKATNRAYAQHWNDKHKGRSSCCDAMVTIFTDTGEPYCKQCYETVSIEDLG